MKINKRHIGLVQLGIGAIAGTFLETWSMSTSHLNKKDHGDNRGPVYF